MKNKNQGLPKEIKDINVVFGLALLSGKNKRKPIERKKEKPIINIDFSKITPGMLYLLALTNSLKNQA